MSNIEKILQHWTD